MVRMDNPLTRGAESGASGPIRNIGLGERTVPHPIMFSSLDKEADWDTIPDVDVKKKGEYAYYPGCVDWYDYEMQFSVDNYGETNHGIIFDSSIKLLRAIGIEPVILDRSFMKCCGHDQLWQGKVDVWNRLREYNEEMIKQISRKSGFKVLVTSCAEGYRTFKLDYDLGDIEVKHITQVLAERGIQFSQRPKVRVTYQDPCRCGRQMPIDPIYEEPRELLRKAGVDYVEMEHFRADATCCGVAGMMYCNEKTKGITNDRMVEAAEQNVDYLLVACPKCLTHFGCQQHENQYRDDREKFKFRVMDITQFLAEIVEAGTQIAPAVTVQGQQRGLPGPGAQPGSWIPVGVVAGPVTPLVATSVAAPTPKPTTPPTAAISPEERQRRIEEAKKLAAARLAGTPTTPAAPGDAASKSAETTPALLKPAAPAAPAMSPEERQRRIEEAKKKAEEARKAREAAQEQQGQQGA